MFYIISKMFLFPSEYISKIGYVVCSSAVFGLLSCEDSLPSPSVVCKGRNEFFLYIFALAGGRFCSGAF